MLVQPLSHQCASHLADVALYAILAQMPSGFEFDRHLILVFLAQAAIWALS